MPPATNIRVCVRVRPLTIPPSHPPSQAPSPSPPEPPASETQPVTTVECWNLTDTQISPNPTFTCPYYDMSSAKNKRIGYQYDHLFTPTHTTAQIYDTAVQSVVSSAMEGYHSSVFAYGQTASGKTYTMQGTHNHPGIVPLAVEECFDVATSSRFREFLLRVSYMEIYNEQIIDLLSPGSLTAGRVGGGVRIYEHKTAGVVVKGLKEEVVVSQEQVFALICAGEAHRHVGSTTMNANSSRSHTIFRLVIESRAKSAEADEGEATSVRVSTLSLVDLAGSESVKQSNTEGERSKEGHFINKSLLTLGHVIYKLSETSRKNPNLLSSKDLAAHIPYRDSKLTRLLQPSLGGNAQIAIVCNVSPHSEHVEETHNTLKFASRAKRIKQTAVVNVGVDDATLLRQYKEEILGLQDQLKKMKEATLMSTKEVGDVMADVEEEETQMVVTAIHNLERLILRDKAKEEKGGGQRKGFFEPQKVGAFFRRGSNQSVGSRKNGENRAIEEEEEEKKEAPLPLQLVSTVRSGTPESVASSHVGESLVLDLQKVQGLLGAVLDKRNERKSNTPSRIGPFTGTPSYQVGSPERKNGKEVEKEAEVEEVGAKIRRLELDSKVHKADSCFLEQQLKDKDDMLKEVSNVLDAIEKHQEDLERENGELAEALVRTQRILDQREGELLAIKGVEPEVEMF